MHEGIMKVPRCNCAVFLTSKPGFIVYFADASDQVQTPAMAAPIYGTTAYCSRYPMHERRGSYGRYEYIVFKYIFHVFSQSSLLNWKLVSATAVI